VFKYYKDLIEFHSSGDPVFFMKCINPNEAKLLDQSSGVRVRFRLAGEKFPPTIHYKIYTYLPIQDLCANAPRDYTKPWTKMKTAAMTNNRQEFSYGEDYSGWYKRYENNGWRPVSNKHLAQMNLEFYHGVIEVRNKPMPFKHNKTLRKEDREAKKKKQKIEWMKKMYSEGMLKAKAGDPETKIIVEEAAKNLISTLESEGMNSIEDWEVNELLEWTNTLNFDDYAQNWNTLGTSTFSNKLIVERWRMKYGSERSEDDNTLSDGDSVELSMQPTIPSTTPHHTSNLN